MRKRPRLRNHPPVIDTIPMIHSTHRPPPLLRHPLHHLLQAFITPYPSNNQHLSLPTVRHRPLRNLHKHRKYRLLQGKTQISRRAPPRPQLRQTLFLNKAQQARKGDIHPLDRIGEGHVLLALLGQLLNVVPRGGVIRQVQKPSKAIQAIPYGDINSLPKDTVPPHGISNHLGIPPTHIQHHGIRCLSSHPPHLHMCHAMIHRDQGLTPQSCQRPTGHGARPKRSAHPRPFRVADAGYLACGKAGFGQRQPDQGHHVLLVMPGRVAWQEPVAWRRNVGLSGVG